MGFQNVQDNGHWRPGGTYTFEYKPSDVDGFDPDDDFTVVTNKGEYAYWLSSLDGEYAGHFAKYGWLLGSTEEGQILFSTDAEITLPPEFPETTPISDWVSAGLATVTNIEPVFGDDGLFYRYTVVLSEEIPVGIYYLKAAQSHGMPT